MADSPFPIPHSHFPMKKLNSEFEQQVEKLHKLTLIGRWLLVVLCWLTLGVWGIWGLRREISLWLAHFTWSAVRLGLVYNLLPAFCLIFCVAMTTAILVWQSRNILFGMPAQERKRLEQQVRKIRTRGYKHPLWKWICQ